MKTFAKEMLLATLFIALIGSASVSIILYQEGSSNAMWIAMVCLTSFFLLITKLK